MNTHAPQVNLEESSAEGFLDDTEVIKRVLNHIDNRTTDTGEASWREPTLNYTSEARFEQELNLIRQQPVVFCPSANLPEAGSYVARELAGVPLLVVRGDDGKLRAFRNACRHRGVQVASGSGKARSFVCPYHAWTYGNQGELKGVPHAKGFPGLDRCSRGLVPIGCEESHGLVFVHQTDEKSVQELVKGLPRLIPEGYDIFSEEHIDLEANWKILLESFLEGYHIRSTHSQTFYPVQYDNLNVIEHLGPHNRLTFPYRPIESLRDKPVSQWTTDGRLTYVYHLFPNMLVTTHPGFRVAILLEPISVDITRQHTYVLTDIPEDNTEGRQELQQVIEVVNAAVVEDRNMVTSAQKGLSAKANEFFEFGLYESAIRHFHASLEQALKKI